MKHLDATLEIALNECRMACRRQPHGRVVLVLEKLEGQVADFWVHEDELTESDVRRIMEAKPRKGD